MAAGAAASLEVVEYNRLTVALCWVFRQVFRVLSSGMNVERIHWLLNEHDWRLSPQGPLFCRLAGVLVLYTRCLVATGVLAIRADETGHDSTAPQTELSIRVGFIIGVFSSC